MMDCDITGQIVLCEEIEPSYEKKTLSLIHIMNSMVIEAYPSIVLSKILIKLSHKPNKTYVINIIVEDREGHMLYASPPNDIYIEGDPTKTYFNESIADLRFMVEKSGVYFIKLVLDKTATLATWPLFIKERYTS